MSSAVRREDYPVGFDTFLRDLSKRLEELHSMVTRRDRVRRVEVADDSGRTAGLEVDQATGRASITSSVGGTIVTARTTTEGANLRIDPSTNELLRVTSSEAGKVDVRDMSLDDDMVGKVRAMRRRVWRDQHEVEDNPNTEHWIPGWIAEEFHAAGLGGFVEYDPTGTPIGVAYDRVPVLLHAWLAAVDATVASTVARMVVVEKRADAAEKRLATAEATIKTQGDRITALETKNAEQDKQIAALDLRLGSLITKLGIKL